MKLTANTGFLRSMIIYVLKAHRNVSKEMVLFLLSLYLTEIKSELMVLRKARNRDKGADVAIVKRVAENQNLNLFEIAWLVQMAKYKQRNSVLL